MTVSFFTLGCKLNQYETDALASEFRAAGFRVVEAQDNAEVCIVNTCTVTNRADRKSRNLINRAGRQFARARLVVVTGCFAETERGGPAALDQAGGGQPAPSHPGSDRSPSDEAIPTLWVDNDRKSEIFRLVCGHPAIRDLVPGLRTTEPVNSPLPPNSGGRFAFRTTGSGFHTRATVKIQDGCDAFCSYCIIPAVRGPARSRPKAEVLAEIRSLCAGGYREIVLTGVNMSRWEEPGASADKASPTGGFTDLVRSILDLELPAGQEFRLRLSSLEPDSLAPDFAGLFRHPRMCPALHLCLQSGSPRVLEAMRRAYDLESYRRLVRELRAVDPDFCLSTDIITGFPGETETEFAESLALIRELDFCHVHVFPYSRRRGTAADRLPDQLPDRIKDARAEHIRQDDAERLARWRRRLDGRKGGSPLVCLVESIRSEERDGREGWRLGGLDQYGLEASLWLDETELPATLAALRDGPRRSCLPPGLAASPLASQPVIALWNRFLPMDRSATVNCLS
jgi:threonylcarbamoyladenosine tRNA methylthiotransferase MtaB